MNGEGEGGVDGGELPQNTSGKALSLCSGFLKKGRWWKTTQAESRGLAAPEPSGVSELGAACSPSRGRGLAKYWLLC